MFAPFLRLAIAKARSIAEHEMLRQTRALAMHLDEIEARFESRINAVDKPRSVARPWRRAAHGRCTVIHRLAANLVLLLHFAFVVLAVFGELGVPVEPKWARVHVPIAAWPSVVNRAGWTCPPTPLENRSRARPSRG